MPSDGSGTDTAASGRLSRPGTTMLWGIVDFLSLLQKLWAARPIHQLSSAGRIIKRFPFFQDSPYYPVGLCWLREAWSGTIPRAKAECRADSRAELPTAERWWCLVHFGGQVSRSVAFHCLQLGIARGLSCDGKWGSIVPDVLSCGWYRSCLHVPDTGFHATQWRKGKGNTRHRHKASQGFGVPFVGMLHLSRYRYGRG